MAYDYKSNRINRDASVSSQKYALRMLSRKILDQINQRLVQGKKFEAARLRELLDESLDELFDSVK